MTNTIDTNRARAAADDDDDEDVIKAGMTSRIMMIVDTKYSESHNNPAFASDDDVFMEEETGVVAARDDDDADDAVKPRMTSRKLLVVVSILLCELCERLTYYSVVANMVLYGTSVLKYSSTQAASVASTFTGVVFIMPLAGGVISDTWAGKFRTIIGGALIYMLGLVLLPLSAFSYKGLFGEDDDGSYTDISLESRRALFMSSLVFIAMGTGGIKANVGPFGAQQLEDLGESTINTFFNWLYWFIEVGSLVAYTGVAYIQQNISFGWGFVIPLGSMAVAILLFVVARPFYVEKPPGGSELSTTLAVIWQVATGKKVQPSPGEKARVFDKARIKHGGKFDDETVESVKAVLRIMPVFFTVIMYWAIATQMATTFIFQGERLDVSVGGVKLPASGLFSVHTVVIIVLIPVVDRLFYPFMEKLGRPLSHLQRMGIGFRCGYIRTALAVVMSGVVEVYRKQHVIDLRYFHVGGIGYILAAVAVVVAGVVEIYRKHRMQEPGGTILQELGGETFNASTMTIFVQVPEYALVGASEVFADVCGIEFAYTQAPKSMQGVLTGLYYFSSGLGGFVATGILNSVKAATKSYPWFDDEINNVHVEYYFFLLGALMLLDFLVFLVIARFYRYKDAAYVDIDDALTVK